MLLLLLFDSCIVALLLPLLTLEYASIVVASAWVAVNSLHRRVAARSVAL